MALPIRRGFPTFWTKCVVATAAPTDTPAIVTRPFEHMTFQFRGDGWLNMTKAAKNYRKRLDDFMSRPDTYAFIRAHIEARNPGISGNFPVDTRGRFAADAAKSTGLIETSRGYQGGTWCHPDLAPLCCELVFKSPESGELNENINSINFLRSHLNYLRPYVEELAQSLGASDCRALVQAFRGGRTPGTWLNMTKAAQAFGKHIDDFLWRPETVECFRELSGLDPENLGSILTDTRNSGDHSALDPENLRSILTGSQGRLRVSSIKATGLIEVVRGLTDPWNPRDHSALIQTKRGYHTHPSVGTWLHPRLSVFFARWLDTKFNVWCDAVIHDLIGSKAELVITKPAESAVMSLPTDYLSALEALVVAERERVRLAAADYRNAPLTAPVRF